MTAAGALVKFGRCCCTIEAGRDKVFVKIGEGGDGYVSQTGDKNVLVLVLSDWQILGIWREKIKHLREKETLMNSTSKILNKSIIYKAKIKAFLGAFLLSAY